MKSALKIFILAIVSFALVAGVMLFYRTKLSPPALNEHEENQFNTFLTAEISSFENLSWKKVDSAYANIEQLIKICQKDSLISLSEAVALEKSKATGYAEHLHNFAFSQFAQSSWPDVNYISRQTGAMLKQKALDGTIMFEGDAKAKLNSIASVTGDYFAAWTVAKVGFSTMQNAKTSIASARTYANKSYLKNNSALKSALNKVQSRLAASNYSSIKRKYDSWMSKGYFEKLRSENELVSLYDEIENYLNNAESIYGNFAKINEVRQMYNNIY